MRFKKYYVMLPILFIIVILFACTNKEDEVVVNSAINVDIEDNIDGSMKDEISTNKENLITTDATVKINFIDKKYKDFWSTIKNNYIDKEYNNVAVVKNNIRIHKRKNEKYMDSWMKELEETYKCLIKEVPEELSSEIEKQYEEFMEYYKLSKSLYDNVFIPNNDYNANIDGEDTINQYYVLADDVRAYTILLKEYMYIQTKTVDFYAESEEYKENKSLKKLKDVELKSTIVKDIKFNDIIKDYYYEETKCKIKNLKEEKAKNKANKNSEYWNKQIDKNIDNLLSKLNKDDKEVLEKQKYSYYKFLKYSKKAQKILFKETDVVDFNYKNNVFIENKLYESNAYKRYNLFLIEYYYLLTNKIEL